LLLDVAETKLEISKASILADIFVLKEDLKTVLSNEEQNIIKKEIERHETRLDSYKQGILYIFFLVLKN
jgi:hypothetical protein